MTKTEEAASVLSRRIAEIDAERRQLDKALRTLVDHGRGRKRTGSASKAPGKRRRSTGRARRGRRRDQLFEAIRRNPDARISEHARTIGVGGSQAAALARQLVDAGAIRRTDRGRYRAEVA